jgi:hypothetical protein
MNKVKWNIFWGVLISLAFFSLLAIRLNFFQKKSEPVEPIQITKSQRPEDSWMNIYQDKRKIGFIHRTFEKAGEKFLFNENVFMQINTMGVLQDINILTKGHLNPDMTISSFDFNLNSGIFRFNAKGHVEGNKLILFTGTPEAQEKSEFPLNDTPHISGSIYDAAFLSKMGKNSSSIFSIFDPSSLSLRNIEVRRGADEVIKVMGKRILTGKYCAVFMGAENCAWLDNDGSVLRETGILGLSMEKVSQEMALAGITDGVNIDLTQVSSIPSNARIINPEKISKIKYRISGITNVKDVLLDGDRQRFENDILSIVKEKISPLSLAGQDFPKELALFLKPEPLIQSDAPQIKAQVNNIIKPDDGNEEKARKIINWVYRNIDKKPALSVPNAKEVLKNKSGDCNEHSVLTVALLRAAGIPAQIEAGLVYLEGRFYYHAWCVLYLDKWITADSVFNQFPADVTHIRFVRGGSSEQLSLMGVIGKIKLEVLEQII